MEIKHLRHLVSVVDQGTFSKAANAIGISQSALSRSIQMLEARLGVTLLNRSTRGTELTPSGKRLYQRAKLIINELDVATSDAKSGLNPTLPFRIGIAPMFASSIITQAIGSFAQSETDLNVSVTTGLFNALTERLSAGELDVVFSNIPFAPTPGTLTVEPLTDIDICYVASAAHPLSAKRSIKPSDVFNYPWAVIDEKNANDLYSYILSSEGVTSSPIEMRTNSLSFLKKLVQEPPWVTLLPQHMVQEDIEQERLAILKLSPNQLKRKAGLLYRTTSADGLAIARFVDLIKALNLAL